MKYIEGQNRNQLVIFPTSLNDIIDQDNEVRFIDLFVESLDIACMGFKIDFVEDGRPAYHPKDLLKLYLYGYLNSIRSSRKLEKATQRNIEVMLLLNGLSPDHNTISNFRRDNPKAIKKVFRATVQIARNFELIGGKLIAGDSTKLKARIENNKDYYRKRQAIVEHPFGTIKRQWGFNYILTKKLIKRAEADVGLIFTAYNLRRLMNILGKEILSNYMKELIVLLINIIRHIWLQISHFKLFYYFNIILEPNPKQLLKAAYI